MKYLPQGTPAKQLTKLLLGLLFISITAFAAEQVQLYYSAQIECTGQNVDDCQNISGQGEKVDATLFQLAYELSGGQNIQLCNIAQDGAVADCTVGGKNLDCGGFLADNTYCNSTDYLYNISCSPGPSGCYADIDLSQCTASDTNETICNELLPADTICALNLSGCHKNLKQPETINVVIRSTLIDSCQNPQSNEICDLINGPDGEQIIDALTPENLDLASDTTKVSQTQLFNYISQHLYQLRQGAPANAQQSSYFFDDAQQGFLPGQQWAASTNLQNDAINDELESIINLSQDGRLSMYVNASFLTARQDLSELEGKSKSQVAMLTTGLDYRLSQGVVGGALSYADGSTEYGKNDSEFDSANYNATVYGSFYKKQWWLDGALNYGLSRFNQQRDIFCTAASCSQISNTYYADYNGSTLSGQIASGYDFIWGGLSLSPFAQWQLGKVKTDSYSEKAEFSGPTATIAIDEQERDFSTASLGGYLRYSFATTKAVLVPYLRVVFNHELKDDAQYISGRLVGAANSDFIVRANDRDNNYATIGTGLSLQMQNGNAGFIDVETVEAYDNLSQYQLTGGWRFIF